MRTRWIVFSSIVLFIGYAYLGFPFGDPFGKNKLTDLHKEVSDAVAIELPPGSTIDQVEQFLRERGIEYTTYEFLGINSYLYENRPDLQEKVKYSTSAAVHDVMNIFILKAGLYMYFFYDEDRRLLWAYVDTGSRK